MEEPPENHEPTDAASYVERGNTYSRQSDWSLALDDYAMAIRLDPNLVEAYFRRGELFRRQRNFDGAIADYSRILELDPQHAAFKYSRRAWFYEMKGELEHAIADYSEAIKINTKAENAAFYHFERGNCHFRMGHLEDAIADYDMAIRLGNTGRAVYNNRGIALSMQGHFDRAASDFEEAVEIVLRLKEHRRTARVLEKGGSGRLDPNDVTAYSIRGGVFFAKGASEEALSDFEAALKLAPENPSTLAGRAISLHALHRLSEATAAWEYLVELDERYRDPEWLGKELGWKAELIEQARKLIAAI